MSQDFDFLTEYGQLPTSALLAILREPDKYQAAAVLAAKTLLAGREITDEDQDKTDESLRQLTWREEARGLRIKALKSGVEDLLDPITNPQPAIEPRKWRNLLLVGITFLFVWNVFAITKNYLTLKARLFAVTLSDFNLGTIIRVAYLPIIGWLLYKRRKLGWAFLMADRIWVFLVELMAFFTMIKYFKFYKGEIFLTLLLTSLSGFFVVFLWKDKITGYFRVDEKTRRRVVVAASILFILYITANRFWFY